MLKYVGHPDVPGGVPGGVPGVPGGVPGGVAGDPFREIKYQIRKPPISNADNNTTTTKTDFFFDVAIYIYI